MGAGPGPGMMHMPQTGSVGPMGGAPRMSSGPPPSAFPRPPSFSTPGPPHAAGVGFTPGPSSAPTMTHQQSGGAPVTHPSSHHPTPGASNPSYDVVHLSARNARLEEKLSKALAKNRSMAKYYDQLLAKTRDAQEREIEDLKGDLMRAQAAAAASAGARDSLQQMAAERDALSSEVASLRQQLASLKGLKGGADADEVKRDLDDARSKLARADGEVASLRAQLATAQASLSSVGHVAGPRGSSTVSESASGSIRPESANPGAASTTLAQMQRMLDAAREERNHERRQAAARDAEMARQLNDIKEQALDRIRESSAAAKEVAALKERVHAAEHERDRLRDRMEEMEGDVSDHRELRRRMQLAEERASGLQKKADRCELAEAKLRAAEANAQNLQEERSQAHKRLQEMTEKLLHVTNEKDVLVRHSAHQVHVEAELANAKRELEQARRSGLAVRAERKEHAVEWNEAAENMGRVLRHHIYSHTRWEKDAGGEVAGAAEAHAHGQRSAVRLVAAAEAEAASLAGEAVDVVRTTRQLLREHAAECAAVIEEIERVHAQRADERIDAALSMLREAEVRAEKAESDAERSHAASRRARAAAERAGVLPSALADPHERRGGGSTDDDDGVRGVTPSDVHHPDDADPDADPGVVFGRGLVRKEDFDDAAERATRKLRRCQFQMLGLAMWRVATSQEKTEGHEMLHAQLVLARREAAVASARAENWERIAYNKGSTLRWSLLSAALLRKAEKARRGTMDDVEFALTQKTLQLQVAVTERDVANEAAARAERELAHSRAVLEGLRREHDGALRQLQKEHGLRVEISDMVKRDGSLNPGTGVDVDLPVSELQKVLAQLADAADRAGELAKIASRWNGRDDDDDDVPGASDEDHDDEGSDKENDGRLTGSATNVRALKSHLPSLTPGAARRELDRDLEACHDALMIMRDEDDADARAERVATQSMGAVPHEPRGSFEKSTRAVKRHALEVKAELLAALVDGAENARARERLQSQCDALERRLADTGEHLASVRGAAVSRAFKGAAIRAREAQVSHARERELRAAAAKSRWGAAGAKVGGEVAASAARRARLAGAMDAERTRAAAAAANDADDSTLARNGRNGRNGRAVTIVAESESDDDEDFGGYKPPPAHAAAASKFDDPNDFKIGPDGSIVARGGGGGKAAAAAGGGSFSAVIRARKAAARAGASSQKRAESAWSGGLRSSPARGGGGGGGGAPPTWDSTPMSPKPEPKRTAVSRTGLRAAKKNDLASRAYGSTKSRGR